MDFLGVVMLFMSGVLRYGTIILLAGAVAGCNDISQTRTDTDAKPRVRAAQWVRNTTDIEWYRIERGEENAVDLALLDDDLDPLARLSVRPAPVSNLFDSDKAVEGVLTLDSDPDKQLTLITQDVRLGEGYMTRMALENQDGDTMRMRTQHRIQSCLDPEPVAGFTEQSGPSCASPVPAGEPPYAVPSCGQPSFSERDRLEYQLTSMKYLKLNPPRKPGVGGIRFDNNGDVTDAWMTVYKDNRDTPLAGKTDVSQWLTDTQTNTIVGTDAQILLTAAYQDRAWRRYVQDKVLKGKIPSSSRKANLFVGCSVSANQQAGGSPRAAECSRSPGLDTLSSIVDIVTFDPTDPGDVIGALAGLWGDPHFYSDELFYDFQGTGDYVLLKSDNDDFEVQGRFEPLDSPPPGEPACSAISVTTAVALRFHHGSVDTTIRMFHGDLENPEVDGSKVSVTDVATALPDNVNLEVEDASYVFVLGDGTRLRVEEPGGRRTIEVEILKAGTGTREYSGLLGGTLHHGSFVQADGTDLGDAPTQDELYNDFGESYRVTGSGSLLGGSGNTYGTSASPVYYPAQPGRLKGLTDAARQTAEASCAEINDQPRRNACLLDTVCMTNPPRVPVIPQPNKQLSTDLRPFVVSGAGHAGQPENVDAEKWAVESCRLPSPRGNSVFSEAENVTLPASGVSVDITAPDKYGPDDLAPGDTLQSTGEVDVFLVHIPPRDEKRLAQLRMNLSFAGEIRGVIVDASKLDNTDNLSDLDLSRYPNSNPQRGFELAEGDGLTLSADRHQLEIRMAAGAIDLDQVRIFVAAQ